MEPGYEIEQIEHYKTPDHIVVQNWGSLNKVSMLNWQGSDFDQLVCSATVAVFHIHPKQPKS